MGSDLLILVAETAIRPDPVLQALQSSEVWVMEDFLLPTEAPR
jgi:hypothetical protein